MQAYTIEEKIYNIYEYVELNCTGSCTLCPFAEICSDINELYKLICEN